MESEREGPYGDHQPPAGSGVLTGLDAMAHGDLLLLLRVAFCDGVLNDAGRRALINAAMRIGIPEADLAGVLARLETVDGGVLRVLAGCDKDVRLRLVQQALGVIALDAETAARSRRLRARLMLLLDLLPDDMPDPKST